MLSMLPSLSHPPPTLSEQPFFFLSFDNGDGKENGLTSCVAIIVSSRPVFLSSVSRATLSVSACLLWHVFLHILCFSPSRVKRSCVHRRISCRAKEIQRSKDFRIHESRISQSWPLVTTLSPYPHFYDIPLPSRRVFLASHVNYAVLTAIGRAEPRFVSSRVVCTRVSNASRVSTAGS